MSDKAKRPAMKPPTNENVGDKRKLELIQLETRYKSSYRLIKDDKKETVIRLAIKPSDPDFPYEIDSLKIQLNIPSDYPTSPCTVQVLNSDIPKGFAINLEKGYVAHVDPVNKSAHQTLVRQMNWLDRNMESLLQQPPAATVRFVSNSHRVHEEEPVKQFIDATSRPISFETTYTKPESKYNKEFAVASSSKPIYEETKPSSSNNSSSSSSASKPVTAPVVKPKPSPVATTVEKSHSFSQAQMSAAGKRRQHEITQLQTRFCDSISIRTNAKESVITLVMTINDCDFTHEQLLGGKDLYIKYHVPALYPLEPCSIEIDNKKLDRTRANWIASGFNEHVVHGDFTLFENLNWLNRHMETLATVPPTVKTAEQEETAVIAALQQKDLKPPLKKEQVSLSVSAPVFTPQPKKKTSLFDEDVKKNKVIIVNDPSLIIEQAEEDEVQVELAQGDDDDHVMETKAAGPSVLSGVAETVIRRGTEIRLMDPKLDNISLFKCSSLHLMVKCNRCKETVQVQNIKSDGDAKERWMGCPTCTAELGIKFIGELVHQGAKSLGLLQLSGCKPYDILPSAYIGTCGSCMVDMAHTLTLSPHDPPRTITCFSCHAKMTCGLGDYTFIRIGSEGGEKLKAADEKQVMKLKQKKKKEDHLVIGEPLPNRGTCTHYGKSNRWFRFSCCNKLYPCDICHDSHEDHHVEMAKRHVCGLCSREQTIVGGKACVCGHEFERAPQRGAFWEGGKGVRNVSTMSRKDPHKRKGMSKTTSKKQERVGVAGKERHQKEPET